MKILTLAEGKMPDSVVAASEREDGVSLKLYSDYNKNAPSGTSVLFSLLPLFLSHGGQRVIFFDGFRILIKDSGCSKMLLEVFS